RGDDVPRPDQGHRDPLLRGDLDGELSPSLAIAGGARRGHSARRSARRCRDHRRARARESAQQARDSLARGGMRDAARRANERRGRPPLEERKANPMVTQNQNGRNVLTPDENRPSWRPQDQTYRGREDERWRDRDERDRDEELGPMQRGGRMGSWDEREE